VGENQTIDLGSNNTFNQQYWILHQQGTHDPDPQTKFIDDLVQQIQIWRAQSKAVLVCLDANENVQMPQQTGLAKLFSKTDLVDLHSYQHPNSNCPYL